MIASKDFNLFLETKGPELTYKNLKVPIENIKVYKTHNKDKKIKNLRIIKE